MVLTTAAIATAAVIGNSDAYQSGNYDKCMLGLMENQDKAMYRHADSVCEYRHPYEKELDRFTIDLKWVTGRDELALSVNENPTKYEVTRAKVIYSEKTCEEATVDDFKFEKEFIFDNEGFASLPTNQDENYKCMQTQNIWGKKARM